MSWHPQRTYALRQRGHGASLDRLYQKALRQVQSGLSIEERPSRAGGAEIEARMTLAQKWHTGIFVKLADGCKLLEDLVATVGIEPTTLGL